MTTVNTGSQQLNACETYLTNTDPIVLKLILEYAEEEDATLEAVRNYFKTVFPPRR